MTTDGLHPAETSRTRGRLVLCGSGEFTPAMADVDREILDGLDGRRARVAIVPTAAGLEDTPKRWIEMGTEHFRALGADAYGVWVLRREDAHERRWCEAVAGADWIYFSGGQPGHLVETMEDTPFWAAVRARHRAGAVLAGASAGAMMFGARTFVPEDMDERGIPRRVWMRGALGLLAGIFVAPHFDAVPEEAWVGWIDPWPDGQRMLGIDEDTALVERGDDWTVHGRGRVLTYRSATERTVHPSGSRLDGLTVSD